MSRPDETRTPPLAAFGAIPRDGEGPVFAEPWQAQAFALTVQLHAEGRFTWAEWAEALGQEIRRAQAAGDPDDGSTYYNHWLAALERLATDKGLTDRAALSTRKAAWARAYEATPHGQPVELARGLAASAES